MNLLSIQDTLKNASDQQLVRLMQSPDSTAPSYLVLSELRRRKEMRTKQAQPPEGTVAQDLTKDERTYADQEGIRSLRMPGYEDEVQAAERNPDEGIEAMREGGAVRMSGGGSSPRPIGELSREDVLEYLQSLRFGPGPRGIRSPYSESALRTRLDEITAGQRAPLIAQSAGDPNNTVPIPELNYEAGAIDPRQPPARFTPGATAVSPTPPAAANPAAPAETLPLPPEPPAGGPPGAPAGSPPAGGLRALTPSAASAAATPEGLPTLQQNMERNLGMFPGIPQELLDRIRDSRTNEGDRRREAQNMALLEAGLRIAGSNNPNFLGAIGEGAAPAAQTYAQQLSQIRQDRRADLQTDMAVAQADLQRRYMAGQISASEYQRQTQMLISNNELAARERASLRSEAGADRRAGEAGSRAERLEGLRVGREEENRLATRINALTNQINVNRQLLSDPGGTLTDPERAALRAEMEQLGRESRSLRARMQGGLGGSIVPGENGAPAIYQLPGR